MNRTAENLCLQAETRLANNEYAIALYQAQQALTHDPEYAPARVVVQAAMQALLPEADQEHLPEPGSRSPAPSRWPAAIPPSSGQPEPQDEAAFMGQIRGLLIAKQWDTAQHYIETAQARWPEQIDWAYWKAQWLRQQNRQDAAQSEYARFLMHKSDYAEAWINLGVCQRKRQPLPALISFQNATFCQPDQPMSWQYLASLYVEQQLWAPAERFLWQALAYSVESPTVITSLSSCLFAQPPRPQSERSQRFLQLGQLLLARKTLHDAEIWASLAAAAWKSHLLDLASAMLHYALELDPNCQNAHATLMWTALHQGRFGEGWQQMEYCWADQRAQELGLSGPAWQGQDLAGKTLVLYCTGGFGDTFQFVRFIPKPLAGRIVLICPPELLNLIRANYPDIDVVAEAHWRQHVAHYDFQMRLMSLPSALGITDYSQIPQQTPYLQADPEAITAWAARLGAAEHTRRIGLVWRGTPKYAADKARSIPLHLLQPLFSRPGVRWFSLQKGEAAVQEISQCNAQTQLMDLDAELTDFSATAAAIRQLDLVISVDTSVAHLAAALGSPVWNLIAYQPCWRWMLDRTDTPWYPNMRLFRQAEEGHWPSVVAALGQALDSWLDQ